MNTVNRGSQAWSPAYQARLVESLRNQGGVELAGRVGGDGRVDNKVPQSKVVLDHTGKPWNADEPVQAQTDLGSRESADTHGRQNGGWLSKEELEAKQKEINAQQKQIDGMKGLVSRLEREVESLRQGVENSEEAALPEEGKGGWLGGIGKVLSALAPLAPAALMIGMFALQWGGASALCSGLGISLFPPGMGGSGVGDPVSSLNFFGGSSAGDPGFGSMNFLA